jgi:metallo-beta-lactamase family protein
MPADTSPSLQFLGAANTVTGSRYLVESGGRNILVDCGLFQGYKLLRERNRAPFPVRPRDIDVVLLTHAHLDHSGYIPALVAAGFRGQVLCTPSTRELCALLLPDSGYLQEEEAAYAKRRGYSRHREPRPLYTAKQAEDSLARFDSRAFAEDFPVAGGAATARFVPAGHLLGASQLRLSIGGRTLHFTGDLGRDSDPLMPAPAPLAPADWLVCESTYGNRQHSDGDAEAELGDAARRVLGRGGVLLIPAFAVGRVQGLLLHLSRLKAAGRIPDVPVFLNSPMALEATRIYRQHHAEQKVGAEDCERMHAIATPVRDVEASKALNERRGPMIIISSSGMMTGGRVLHHLAAFGGDERNGILVAGFQAGGTRGAALVGGSRRLRMFGRDVEIRAEVIVLGGLSGHADADELIAWLQRSGHAPRMTFVTHGEPDAADVLRARIRHELGWAARVPDHLERAALD